MWLAASHMLMLLLGARGQTLPAVFLLAMPVCEHEGACVETQSWLLEESRFRSITQTAHATATTLFWHPTAVGKDKYPRIPPCQRSSRLFSPTHPHITLLHFSLISTTLSSYKATVPVYLCNPLLSLRDVLYYLSRQTSQSYPPIAACKRYFLLKGLLRLISSTPPSRNCKPTLPPLLLHKPLVDSVLLNQHQSSTSSELNFHHRTTKHQHHQQPHYHHHDFHSSPARPGSSPPAQRLLQHRRHHPRIPGLCLKTAQQPLPPRCPSRRDLRATTIAAPLKTRLCLRHP